MWSRKELLDVYTSGNPVCVNIEINERCNGGCRYCYASPVNDAQPGVEEHVLTLEKFTDLLRLRKIGVQVVYLYGGDQLLHPDFKAMVFRAIEKGFHVVMPLSGLITRPDATWLVDAHEAAKNLGLELFAGIHLDTLDQATHDLVNCSPGTLQARLDGFQALLDAGFPPDHVFGCPTITAQTAETMLPLMNFFYAKGVKHVATIVFKPIGLGSKDGAAWEPSLSQLKRIFYHRASVEGKHMLAVGSSDGRYACQGHVAITARGDIVPCLFLRDLPAGNIYEDDVVKIVKNAKQALLFKFKVKGPCASCKFKLYCCGCRANAHVFLGNIAASDPKCFFNPEAPERCLTSGSRKSMK